MALHRAVIESTGGASGLRDIAALESATALALNLRPRKRLGYRTPQECFDDR